MTAAAFRLLRTAVAAAWRAVPAHRAALLAAAVGGAVVCALAAVFAAILDNVLDGDGITMVDRPVSAWLATHRLPAVTAVLRAVTLLGGPPVLVSVLAVTSVITARHARSVVPVVTGAMVSAGFGLTVLVVKLVVARPRPAPPYQVGTADGYSFPSGHATTVTGAAIVCGWMLTHWWTRSRAAQYAIRSVVVIVVAGVGFSRIYLGVHFLSDVIAGWVLGAGWAAVGIAAARLWQMHPGKFGMPKGFTFECSGPCPRPRSVGEHRAMTDDPTRTHPPASVRDRVRVLNKYVTNPLMMPLAGRKHWYASVIRHVGRRTGAIYATPVVAELIAGGFIIPLPYGTRVDWLRNVQHNGTATIRYKGCTYDVTAPEIIDAATAAPLLSPARRRQFQRFGIDRFVELRLA
jgi:undecaprenyl-diphosphatase